MLLSVGRDGSGAEGDRGLPQPNKHQHNTEQELSKLTQAMGPLTQATGPPWSDAGVGIGMLRGISLLSAV